MSPLLDTLERELERVCERLRSVSLTRLATAVSDSGLPSRAEQARALAVRFAALAWQVERGSPSPALPRLPDAAVADQLAVTGHDLVEAARGLQASVPVVEGERWRPLGAALESALTALAELRRQL